MDQLHGVCRGKTGACACARRKSAGLAAQDTTQPGLKRDGKANARRKKQNVDPRVPRGAKRYSLGLQPQQELSRGTRASRVRQTQAWDRAF